MIIQALSGITADPLQEKNISPNDDGAKETLAIYQNVRGREDDVYVGEIVNSGLDVVRSYEWTGAPPVEILWDGRDDQGSPLDGSAELRPSPAVLCRSTRFSTVYRKTVDRTVAPVSL